MKWWWSPTVVLEEDTEDSWWEIHPDAQGWSHKGYFIRIPRLGTREAEGKNSQRDVYLPHKFYTSIKQTNLWPLMWVFSGHIFFYETSTAFPSFRIHYTDFSKRICADNLTELYYSGSYLEVIQLSTGLIESGDTGVNNYFLKALSESQLGQTGKSIHTLQQASILHPEERRFKRMLAAQYFEAGDYTQSRKRQYLASGNKGQT